MPELHDERPGEAAYKAAKARGDTQGQHRAQMRIMRDKTRQLIGETAPKRSRKRREWRAKIRIV